MHALIYDGKLRFVSDYPYPERMPGEALIRPHLIGICNTDIEITHGYMGFHGVLGHEFVGTVLDSDDTLWIGQRVVGEINAACRQCETCRQGTVAHCPHRTTLGIDRRNGAMAEAFVLPNTCLHVVPDNVPDHIAVFTEPLAAALEIMQQTHIQPTDRIAVVGDGKLGTLIAQVLRLPGCDVTMIGRHPKRWDLFRRQHIHCMHITEVQRTQYDLVIECSGQPSGLDTARHLVRPGGRLVLKSTFHNNTSLNPSLFVIDEIQLIGSRCGPFTAALRLLERGLIETTSLISGYFALHDGPAAFAAAQGQLKILIHPVNRVATV